MGLCNLLKSIGTVATTSLQKLVFNTFHKEELIDSADTIKLALVDHIKTCAERKIMKP